MSTNTWNPADTDPDVRLSNGNLTGVNTDALGQIHHTLSFPLTGSKPYWEIKHEGQFLLLGVCAGSHAYDAVTSRQLTYYSNNGNKYPSATAYGTAYNSGDIIGCAFDSVTGGIWFRKNGVWQGAGQPSTAPNSPAGFVNPNSGPYSAVAYFQVFGSVPKVTANFGATAFRDAPPSGFAASSVVITSPSLGGPSAFGGTADMTFGFDGSLSKKLGLAGTFDISFDANGVLRKLTGLSADITLAFSGWANIISTLPSKLFITAATSHHTPFTCTVSEMVS